MGKKRDAAEMLAAAATKPAATATPKDEEQQQQQLAKLMRKIDKASGPKRALLEAKLAHALDKLAAQPAKPKAAAANGGASSSKPAFVFKLTTGGVVGLDKVAASTPGELKRRAGRQQRFLSSFGSEGEPSTDPADEAIRLQRAAAAVVGTSAALEKEYLRLTALPCASSVRPPAVLAAALKLVKARWLEGGTYEYVCEQLKSIRQDLTVQHMTDALARDAYETHGRIALEVGDMAEFRQCHAVLRKLHASHTAPAGGSAAEFEAYNLLYTLSAAPRNLASEMMQLDVGRPGGGPVDRHLQHALAVCAAVSVGDTHRFLSLYGSAPRMAPYLMDRLLPAMRARALQLLLVGHRPTAVPLHYVALQLGFEDADEAARFAHEQGAVVDVAAGMMETALQH